MRTTPGNDRFADKARVEVRPSTVGDRERLFEIHHAALGPYVEQIWGWDHARQAKMFADRFGAAGLQVVLIGATIAGFYSVIENAEAITLSTIEIDPAYQGQGVGSRIVSDLIHRAEASRRRVRLQVFKINHRARALYRRLNFIEVSETEFHVQMAN